MLGSACLQITTSIEWRCKGFAAPAAGLNGALVLRWPAAWAFRDCQNIRVVVLGVVEQGLLFNRGQGKAARYCMNVPEWRHPTDNGPGSADT